MKVRKNLSLSRKAVAKGEQVAVESGRSLSAVIESQLLAIPTEKAEAEAYWSGPALKPVERRDDPRYQFLKRKHA